MREQKLTSDKFGFISILEVEGRKAVNEHATLRVKGHIASDNDDYVLRSSAGQSVAFTASGPDGTKKIFHGLISDISIHNENEMRILTVSVVSRSALMDIEPETRTFQDSAMTYETVTGRMEEKNGSFNFLWPSDGGKAIGSMTVQYKETDWEYSKYEGDELVHYYTLKEDSGFYTQKLFNENLSGASLRGTVKEITEDKVRVNVAGDVKQTKHKWFPYATPFSQPDGYGWYFMPEVGDEIRLQFPSEQEHDAYVSSAVHITHGNRSDPEIKYIRTVYGQIIQFDPEKILIDDGAGSTATIHKNKGITIATDKTVNVDAQSDITMSAQGKVVIKGEGGVVLQKNGSVVSVDDAVDVSSAHTRVQ